MLKPRHELEQKLESIITEYNENKKVFNDIKKKIMLHGYTGGDFQRVWSKNKALSEVALPVLYLLTKYIYDRTGDDSVKTEDYFTEVEMRDGDNFKKEVVEETIEYPITFENVIKVRNDQFMTSLPIQKIKLMMDNDLINYNFDTQRGAKHKIDNTGELVKIANINKMSVKEITNDIIKEDFIPNVITLNLLQDGNDEFIYNEKKNELTILDGEINIIDGFHRSMAFINALAENPTIDQTTEVRLTNWGVEKCRRFILQEDKKNKINKHYIQSINSEKMGNRVVAKLNDGYGDIKGKITTDFTLIKMNRAYAMSDMMANTIDLLWDIKTNMEVNTLSKYLNDVFDFIIGYKANDFITDLEKSREKSVITYPSMFVGYLTIAKYLQNDSNWQDKLTNFLDNTNFSVDNDEWIRLNIVNKNKKPTISLNKSGLKNIIAYCENLMK